MADNKVKFLRGTSDKYAVAEKDSDAIYFTTDDGKLYIGDKEVSGGSITIDDSLSDTSENPVQNKVVNSALNNKADKSKYGDTTINIGRRANTTVGEYSTAEGNNTVASGKYSHTEGSTTSANGNFSHAEGISSSANGIASHAEGRSRATGDYSHAEGYNTVAAGNYSHTGGLDSTADGLYSFAHGYHVNANNENEVAFGKYNTSNTDILFSVGDGTSSATHNAFEITSDGGKLHDKNIATTDMLSEIQDGLTSHTHDSRYYTEAEIDAALAGKANTSHTHTKSEITDFPTSLPASDVSEWAKAATKPTYTASEVGADTSGSANAALTAAKAYTDTEIAGLINGAPTTLDTLGEIATAMSENQSVVEALNSAVGTKANVSDLTAHTGNTSNPHSVTKAQVGLENVPNVSTNDQTPTYSDTTTFETLTSGEKISVALGKIKLAITNLINHIANKSNPHGVTKSQIGLGNVGNFKAVSTVAGQGLTEDEKANARTNIGAGASSFSGDYNDLSNKPVVDTALSSTSTNSVQNKVVNSALNNKADKSKYGDTTINVGRRADTTVGSYSTAEGSSTTASGNNSHAEGSWTTASGNNSHAEGYGATASGNNSHAEGSSTTASGSYSHAEGYNTTASGSYSHAEGSNKSVNDVDYVDRTVTISDVDYTIKGCTAYGINSHAEGTQTFAYGYSSHAEGQSTTASGSRSHAEGYSTTASGNNSHAEGYGAKASGDYSHAEGSSTTASGSYSHAEGQSTTTSGNRSHAEGYNTTASGNDSHAGGNSAKASGNTSFAHGYYVNANNENEVAFGTYNISNTDDTLFSIGDGTSDTKRHNAFEITTDGAKAHDQTIVTLLPRPWYEDECRIDCGSMTFTRITSAKSYNVEFSEAFGTIYAVIVTPKDSTGSTSSFAIVTNKSGTGFTVKANYAVGFDWIAIGTKYITAHDQIN